MAVILAFSFSDREHAATRKKVKCPPFPGIGDAHVLGPGGDLVPEHSGIWREGVWFW